LIKPLVIPVPGIALFGLWFAEYFLIHQINFTGQSLVVVLNGLLIPIAFYGANHPGLPLAPLVASLGVGGLAVALAARPTIEKTIVTYRNY
jgi:small-conductance mechanosensitive channel